MGTMVIIFGLPWSNFLMSLGQLILFGNWILEWNLATKVKRFINNKTALALFLLFAVHLLGLLWTSDFEYAIKDLKIKLPILFLPIVFSSGIEYSKKEFKWLIQFFLFSVAVFTLVSFNKYLQIENINFYDKRDLAINISHIRFSLLISLSFFFSLYLFYKNKSWSKAAYGILAIWFFIFTFILESYSGIIITSLVLPFVLLYYFSRIQNSIKKVVSISVFSLFLITTITIVISRINKYEFYPKANQILYEKSESGESFNNDTTGIENKYTENGYFIYSNIAYNELEREWNKVGDIPYKELDKKGNPLFMTLIQFLTSKGERKDSAAVTHLNKNEVAAIENGIANVKYLKAPYFKRIDKIIWEIDNYYKGLGANGHSVAARIVYWKQAWLVIQDNFWLGTGTGDIKNEFEKSYDKYNPTIPAELRLRAHNQFLTFWATFGIIGFLLILFSISYPLFSKLGSKDYYFFIFLAIALFSMINEDTIETQAGVTFFAFFNSFLLLSKKKLK